MLYERLSTPGRFCEESVFFYLELEERGQVGPSPYMDLCVLTFDAEKLARPGEIWSFEKGKDAPYRDQIILPSPCPSSRRESLGTEAKSLGLKLGSDLSNTFPPSLVLQPISLQVGLLQVSFLPNFP